MIDATLHLPVAADDQESRFDEFVGLQIKSGRRIRIGRLPNRYKLVVQEADDLGPGKRARQHVAIDFNLAIGKRLGHGVHVPEDRLAGLGGLRQSLV